MNAVYISLLIIATLIISGLAFYAGKLFAQIRKQTRQRQQAETAQQVAITQHNQKQIDSICLIAKAVGEEQCELSEGAIRICRLLEKLYLDRDANFPQQYPALHELDGFLSDYPTHTAYKQLPRKERMRFDVKRAQHEDKLKIAIHQECLTLKTFSL